MLRIDRSARTGVEAPRERCIELLADVERYPEWAGPIARVERLGESRVRLHAHVFGLGVELDCEVEIGPDRALLRRVPYASDDDERFVATWTLREAEVELHVEAALDAPGPASLLRGRVERRLVDDLLEDFRAAVESASL